MKKPPANGQQRKPGDVKKFGWNGRNRQKTNRMSDVTGAYDGGGTGAMSGIIAGTRVATSMGWRDVGAIQEGDMVLTFDGGLQPVVSVRRKALWSGSGVCPADFWPLIVPAGALENAKPMRLLPRQGVMLESDVAEAVLGDPFALIPAAALEGVSGIERVFPNDPVEAIALSFETDQVVFAEQGALLFCPGGGDLVQAALGAPQRTVNPCAYEMLPATSAVHLARGLETRGASETCLERFRAALRGGCSEGCVAA